MRTTFRPLDPTDEELIFWARDWVGIILCKPSYFNHGHTPGISDIDALAEQILAGVMGFA